MSPLCSHPSSAYLSSSSFHQVWDCYTAVLISIPLSIAWMSWPVLNFSLLLFSSWVLVKDPQKIPTQVDSERGIKTSYAIFSRYSHLIPLSPPGNLTQIQFWEFWEGMPRRQKPQRFVHIAHFYTFVLSQLNNSKVDKPCPAHDRLWEPYHGRVVEIIKA